MDSGQEAALLQQGAAAQRAGDLRSAAKCYAQVVQGNPSHVGARRGLALLMAAIGDADRAVEHMRIAAAAMPGEAQWQYDLGQVLERAGLFKEALAAFEDAERLDGTQSIYAARVGVIKRRLRDVPGARAAAGRAIAIDPNQEAALQVLAQDARADGRLEEAEDYARRATESAADPMRKSAAWHELGRILERAERLDEAFDAHAEANRLVLSTPQAQAAMRAPIPPFMEYLGHGGAKERYATWAAKRFDDGVPEPVILTGFPRSGTTMAEQILAAHPRLATSEERGLLIPAQRELTGILGENREGRALLDMLDELTDEQLVKLRGLYRAELERAVPVGEREGGSEGVRDRILIDKHPLRLLDMGLVNRLFPGARVIVMVRDPRDVCLSALFQDFAINPAMVRFTSLGLCGDWYARVMRYWLRLREQLSLEMLEVRYEDLVGDFDTWARRMVEFSGVEWDERVREFHVGAGGRAVTSASYEAVTEALHSRSIGRWKKHEARLGPLLEKIGEYVEKLGYEA